MEVHCGYEAVVDVDIRADGPLIPFFIAAALVDAARVSSFEYRLVRRQVVKENHVNEFLMGTNVFLKFSKEDGRHRFNGSAKRLPRIGTCTKSKDHGGH